MLRTETGLVVKRLRFEDDGWIMISDNAGWVARAVEESDRILGRAVWFGPEKAVVVGA